MPSFDPEFFDIFGIICFSYIVGMSYLALVGEKLPMWTYVILLFIGIAGLLVDGSIVYSVYFK